VAGRAHQLALRDERALLLGLLQRGAEQLGRGVREDALAQSLAREPARERLAPVMRLDLRDGRAHKAAKDLALDEHALRVCERAAT
jgi:hypothetical protein